MIELNDLNGRKFVLNSQLIETVEEIPETKITLTNGKYILVSTGLQEIIDKVVDFNSRIYGANREIKVVQSEVKDDFDDYIDGISYPNNPE